MIEIIQKPKQIIKRVFHCNCGCVFQADRGDYELITHTIPYEIKYKIQCPFCGLIDSYTDKNSEYKYIEL